MTEKALDNLAYAIQQYEEKGRPFFVAVGLHYPHCDWHIPQWVTELYPPATNLSLPAVFAR